MAWLGLPATAASSPSYWACSMKFSLGFEIIEPLRAKR